MTKHFTYKADGNVTIPSKIIAQKLKITWRHIHGCTKSQCQNDDFDMTPSKYLYTTTENIIYITLFYNIFYWNMDLNYTNS